MQTIMTRSLVASALVAITLGSGCATVFKSKTTTVSITSNTPGEAITIDGRAAGVTPSNVEVPAQGNATIVVGHGSHQQTCMLTTHASTTWVVADIFLTSGLGLIIDWVTHAWNDVGPSECHAAV